MAVAAAALQSHRLYSVLRVHRCRLHPIFVIGHLASLFPVLTHTYHINAIVFSPARLFFFFGLAIFISPRTSQYYGVDRISRGSRRVWQIGDRRYKVSDVFQRSSRRRGSERRGVLSCSIDEALRCGGPRSERLDRACQRRYRRKSFFLVISFLLISYPSPAISAIKRKHSAHSSLKVI